MFFMMTSKIPEDFAVVYLAMFDFVKPRYLDTEYQGDIPWT